MLDVAPSADMPPAIEATSLHKVYGPTVAVESVDLKVASGRITTVMGANGAGKSTVMRMLAGVTKPDAGNLLLAGVDVWSTGYSARRALELGLVSVYQEISLCTNLSVMENFALTHHEMRGRARGLQRTTAGFLDDVFPHSHIAPSERVGRLSLAQRQLVEIARAVSQPGLKVLILDEPTSALDDRRSHELYEHLRRLQASGVAVLMITHSLEEALGVGNDIVVLRDGKLSWSGAASELTKDALLRYLGGGERDERGRAADTAGLEHRAAKGTEPHSTEDIVLEVRGVSGPSFEDVSIHVGRGELVGISGPEGAGQRSLLREIRRPTRRNRKSVVCRGGIAYVSGDRHRDGIFPLWDVRANIVIGALPVLTKRGIVPRRRMADVTQKWFELLRVRAPSLKTPIGALSGGNQQKVLIARGFASEAELVILDDPTRGVDLAAKAEVQGAILDLLRLQKGVLLYTTDDSEFAYCSRVYVMREGKVVRELSAEVSPITREDVVYHSYNVEK